MGAARVCLSANLRRRWPAYLALVVLLALGSGGALAAVAGARRTISAFPRYLDDSRASDLSVSDTEPATLAALGGRSAVVRSSSYVGFYCAPLTADGEPDLSVNIDCIGSRHGRFFTQDRPDVVAGRMPDPSAPNEAVINAEAARRLHFAVGQSLELGFADPAEIEAPGSGGSEPTLALSQAVRVVGVVRFNVEIVQDEIDASTQLLLTPAFTEAQSNLASYSWTGIKLKGGRRAVPQAIAAYRGLAAQSDFQIPVRDINVTLDQVQRSVRPQAWALALLGITTGLATVVLVGQALVRQVRSDGEDRAALLAIGMAPRSAAAVAAGGSLAVVVAGSIAGVVVAVALSPLSPVGPVRSVEPHPGWSVDPLVLGAGTVVLALLVGAQPALAAARLRQAQAREAAAPASRLVSALASGPAPVSAVAGTRLALEPGRGRSSLPVRTTLASGTLAIAVLVGAVVWGTSLRTLVDTPRLAGWDWDTTLYSGAGYGSEDNQDPIAANAGPVLSQDGDISDWALVEFQAITVDGIDVASIGLTPGQGTISPPVVSGRPVQGDAEIVLGTKTLDRLHRKVGDTVQVGADKSHTMRVVGAAVMPTLGVRQGDRSSLGVGAVLDQRSLRTAYAVDPENPSSTGAILVRFRPGVDHDQAVGRLAGLTDRLEPGGGLEILAPQRAAELVNFRTMGSAPIAVAALLGAMALGALANALVATVRRRRRELALFKTLGFTRRQVSVTVLWQATVTMVIVLAIGIPLGIAAGRVLWTAFARSVGVVPTPEVPVATLLAVAVGVSVLANVVAAIPARRAARVRPAVALRTE